MSPIHDVLGVAVFVSSALAGAWGAWRWYRVEPSALFWRLLRISQVLVVLAGLDWLQLWLRDEDVAGLQVMYGVLPLAIHFIGEQLRIAAAETVLVGRGLEDAAAVGELPEAQQRSVVLSIVRREIGVMSAAALVSAVLAGRAAGWF